MATWRGARQTLAAAILKDPDVDSLSSFIGVDGSNITLNSGRMLINLKPVDDRSASASRIIRRLQRETAGRRRHLALHAAGAGPDDRRHGQPHPVPVRARGRQSRLSSTSGCRSLSSACSSCRSSKTSRAIRRTRASRPIVTIDRDTAGALRHHAGDDRQRALRRLRPAHRLDHLHPVEPVPRDPGGRPLAQASLDSLGTHLSALSRRRRPGAAVGARQGLGAHRAPVDRPSRPVPRDHDLLQPGAGCSARASRRRHQARRKPTSACRTASSRASRARRSPSRRLSATSSS